MLLRKCLPLSTILAIGNAINLLSYVLLGMSPTLGLPQRLPVLWSGLILNGLAYSLMYAPVLPYLVDSYT